MSAIDIIKSRLNDMAGEKGKLYSSVLWGNETIINKEELEEIKQELLEHQFLKKLHNQMKEEMEREQKAKKK